MEVLPLTMFLLAMFILWALWKFHSELLSHFYSCLLTCYKQQEELILRSLHVMTTFKQIILKSCQGVNVLLKC